MTICKLLHSKFLNPKKIILLLILGILLGTNLIANQTKVYKWDGSKDNQWSDIENWTVYIKGADDTWSSQGLEDATDTSLPGKDDDIVLDTSSGDISIEYSGDIEIHGLITYGSGTALLKNSSSSQQNFSTDIVFIGCSSNWYRTEKDLYVGVAVSDGDIEGTLKFSGNSLISISYLDTSSWVSDYNTSKKKNTLILDSSTKAIIQKEWAAGINPQPDGGSYVDRTALTIESGGKLILNGNITGVQANKEKLQAIINASVAAGATETPANTKTFTWKGGTTDKETDWNTPSNWINNNIPQAVSEVIIQQTTNNPVLSVDVSISKLNISSGVELDLNGCNLTVSSEYKNSGTIISKGTETVTLPSNSTESGTWSFTAGNILDITNLSYSTIQIDGNVTQNADLTCNNLIVNNDFTGSKITVNNTLTVNSGNILSLTDTTSASKINNNGIIDAGSQSLTLNSYSGTGKIQINGGTLTNSTGATVTIGTLTPGTTESTLDGATDGFVISAIDGTTGKLKTQGVISLEGELASLNLDNGTLTITGNTTSGSVTNSGTIEVGSNTLTLGTYSGNGEIKIDGGTLANSAATTIKTLTLGTNQSTLQGTGNYTITDALASGNLLVKTNASLGGTVDTLNINSGTTTFSGTSITSLTIASGATLELSAATSAGTISNAGTIDIGSKTLSNTTSYSGSGKLSITGGTFNYSGAAAEVSSIEITTSATLNGGSNGTTVIAATYGASPAPALTTQGKVTLPGGTIGALDVASGSTTLSDDITASNITIETSGNLTTAAGKTINLSGNWTNKAGASGYTYTTSGTINFKDTATITGDTNFYNFTAENLSSKTLTIDSAIKINGTLKLSGASYSNPLTVDGSGTLTLNSSQIGGKFLVVTNVGRISTATTTYTATVSRSTNNPIPDGWIFSNKYKWNGNGTNWDNASSWDINTDGNNYSTAQSYPQYPEDEVIIDNTSTHVAALPSALSLKSVTVNTDATLDLLGYNLTVPAITNSGTIKLYGTQTIATSAGGVTNGTDSTIEYYGSKTVSSFFTTSFKNLKVDTGSILKLGATDLSANTVDNSGEIQINGSGSLSITTSLSNVGTVSLSSTGTINQTDATQGTFIYNGASSVLALNYYDLQISADCSSPSNAITVANTLTVDANKTLTLGGAVDAAIISNSGTIACGSNNLGIATYSGTSDKITATTGSITKSSGSASTISSLSLDGGNLINSSSNLLTVTALTLSATQSSLQGGTDGITITNAISSGKVATSGTVSLKGQLTGLTVSSGTTTLSDTSTITNLTIANGATLEGTSNTLTINGAWSNSGTYNANNGKVILSGTPSISGTTTFYDLQISADCSTLTNTISVGNELSVDANKTLTLGGAVDAATISNSGTIACGANNLEFAAYSGTSGKITASTGSITLKTTGSVSTISSLSLDGGYLINSSSNLLTVTALTLSATQSFLQAGTGGITITNAISSGKVATSGTVSLKGQPTNLTVSSDTTTLTGTSTITNLTIANGATLDKSTNSGDLTISGTSPSLTVNGTLAVGGNNLKLTGTSSEKVTVTGTGSITITNSQINGEYISITAASGPTVSGGTYTAIHSTTATNSPTKGWNILSGDLVYVWNGSSSTAIGTPGNWNTNLVPGTSDSIQIQTGCSNYPLLAAAATYENVTVDSGATLDFAGQNLTATAAFTNNGKIRLTGGNTISTAASKTTFGNNSEIEYYGNSTTSALIVKENNSPINTASLYKKLTITGTDTILQLGNQNITVSVELSNNGTIEVNGTGIFNITGTPDSDSGLVKYSSINATTKTIPNIGFYNLEISAGTWTDTNSAGISTTNNFTVSGGNFTCNGDLSVGKDCSLSAGSLTTNGTLSVGTDFNVKSTLTANGTLLVSNALTVDTTSDVKFNNGIGGQTSSVSSATFTKGTIYFGNDKADSFSVTGSGKSLSLSGTPNFHIAGTLSGANGITVGTDLSADAPTTFSSAVTLSGNSAISNGTNTITFSSTINGGFDLSTTGSGAVTFSKPVGASTQLASLTIAGTTNLNCAAVKTSGAQTYKAISLGSTAELTAVGTITLGGAITDITPTPAYTLTLSGNTTCNAGTITVNKLTNSSGKTFTIGAPLTITGEVDNKGTISSTAAANTLSITGNTTNSGTIDSAASITLTGNLTNSGTIKSSATTTITGSLTNTGTVNSSSSISLTGNLTDTTGTWTNGSIIFNGTDNQTFAPNTGTTYPSVSFENTGNGTTVTISDDIKITTVTNPAGKNSNITFSKGGTVTNAATFNTTGTVTLGSDAETSTFKGGITHTSGTTTVNGTVSTTDSAINFGELNSAAGKSITLTSGTGNITLNGTVSTTNLSATSTGTINVNTASVTTTGTQTFDGAVTVGNQATTFHGTTVNFKNTLTGQNALTISGKADFDNTVSGFTTLSVSGTSNIAGNITTSDNQTYTGAVTLDGSDITFKSDSGKLINFKAAFTGNSNDVTISDANSQFDGAITRVKNLSTANVTLNETTTGIGTGNLTINGTADINKTVTGFVDLSITSTAAISANITSTGNQTYTGAVTLDGEDLTFKSDTGKLITFSSSVTGNSKDLLIDDADVQFGGAISTIKNLTTEADAKFNGTVSCSGNLNAKSTATINSSAITTTGTQTYTGNLTISASTTISASALNSNIINASANTSTTIVAGNISFNDDSTFTSANLTITNSGLFTSADQKNIVCDGFTQNGTGKNMIGGNLTSTYANWTTDLYIYGTADSQFTGTLTCANNLIIAKADSTLNFTITSNGSVRNFVLYSGNTTLKGNLSTSLDAVLLGSNFSNDDKVSGTTNSYRYEQTRYSGSNTGIANSYTIETTFPDSAGTPIPTNQGTLKIDSGKKISIGKNFYANGISITGDIQIPDNTDSTINFAEAYNCTVTNSNVSAKSGSAKIACEDCTFSGTTTNWNQDGLIIKKAYTVRDNVVFVEFNRTIRNKHGELLSAIENGFFTLSNNHLYTGAYKDPDCQTALGASEEVNSFYIKSEETWNTDATGSDAGSEYSTDRTGTHKEETPFLDIVRNDGTYSWLLTDIYGKRLENYSKNTTIPGVAYGSQGDTTHGAFDTANHKVEDKTGPVLYSVRTGQELHDIPDGTAESQHSYDSHNFIEFRYSEATNFGSQDSTKSDIWIPAFTDTDEVNLEENVQVSDYFGALIGTDDSITKTGALNFKGLGKISSGKIYTGKDGSVDRYVNALYRKDPYSICISIAGYTEGTVTDPSGNEFKKWIGYIESAEVPSGSVTMNFSTSTLSSNVLVSDILGNFQKEYKGENLNTIPKVDCKLDGTPIAASEIYGTWDISEPIFAPLRMSVNDFDGVNTWTENLISGKYQSEAIGNTSGTGSTLDRIEFHLFDNTPTFASTEPEWVSEIGWCNPDSDGKKSDLYKEFSYSADIFGGSRVFDDDSTRRTSGGIRYSSVCNEASAFKYINSLEDDPTLSFSSSINAYSGANGLIFTGTSSPRRSALDLDGLYFGLAFTNSEYDIKETFTVSYDSTNSFITDLAGNRLRSKVFTTIDRTPPSFDISLSPLNQDEIYITFVKKLITNSNQLAYIDNENGYALDVSDSGSYEQLIPSCFKIISIDENGIPSDSTSIQIDTTRPAVIMDRSNNSFTCIKLYLTQNVTLSDVQNLYISLISHPDYEEYSQDPFTSHKNSRVTFIQDSNKNYMEMYTAHALSDFAINSINPLYAYDEDMSAEDDQLMNGLYEDGSWAVHDWTAEQKNYGTLPADHSIGLVTDIDDGTTAKENLPVKVRVYLSNNPDKDSISNQYNNDLKLSDSDEALRIWLPAATDKVFNSLAEENNTNYSYVDSQLLDSENQQKGLLFDIPKDITTTWNSGDQITFLFGLMDSNNQPVNIIHSPELNLDADEVCYLTTSTKFPLYALRLKTESDITSIDLWSFKIKSITEQRGGVSILNNVINNSTGEKTVVKVNLPEAGKLNVIVMTLDGNVVTYLNRGQTTAGEHYYAWDGKNRNGKPVARGLYFVRVFSDTIDETRKVMVVK